MTLTENAAARVLPRASAGGQIDARGPRFGAAFTTVVLAVVLITAPSPVATALLAWQTLVFALGGLVGLSAQPYGVLFRRVFRPHLSPPTELEDVAPPRFAQLVGLGFALVGLTALLVGAILIAQIAVGLALAAAFLNAAFNFCLGCEVYLLGQRLWSRRVAA